MANWSKRVSLIELGVPFSATLAEARIAMSNSDSIGSLIDVVPVTRTVRISFLWKKSQKEWSDSSRFLAFVLCTWVGLAMLVLDDGGTGLRSLQPEPDLVE